MTGDAREPEVRRVDERLGLAVARASLSGRTLVTYARDHVSVRTPSRSDLWDGNTLDLEFVPSPDDLDRWITRFEETIATIGARHVQLRWEVPLDPEAPPAEPSADAELVAAFAERGFGLTPTTVQLLEELVAPPPVDAELGPVPPPSAVPGGPADRRWHAATVLYRYAASEDPSAPVETWRTWDEELVAWSVDVQRELVAAGRGQVWVAQRHGGPVGRATLLHDRQGLAAVEDVVVHPVHRRQGIASALTAAAVRAHLDREPAARIGVGAEPGSGADRLYRRLGFRPHATVWTARRPA